MAVMTSPLAYRPIIYLICSIPGGWTVHYGCQPTASGLNDVADWSYSYPQEGANTGIDVSSGGDTNADGYDELLVGVHLYDDEQANEGAVIAFFGSAWAAG